MKHNLIFTGSGPIMIMHTYSDISNDKLIAKLAAKTGLKIELQEKIDPTIIGGMIIILQNQIVDGSIRYDLSELKNRLMNLKVH